MSKIIDRTGKGSSISQAEFDGNYDTLHGINQAIAGTSHTVDITDQGDTLEFTSGSAVAVTLDSIATILAASHTSDFKVTLVAIGAGAVTITPDALDSFNIAGGTYTLEQNEYVTLQTDSTNAIWNIINASNARSVGGLYATQFVRSDVADSVAGLLTFAGNNVHNGDEVFNGDETFNGQVDLDGLIFIGGSNMLATSAELNILNGAALSTDELNYNNITMLGTAEAGKAVTVDSGSKITIPSTIETEIAGLGIFSAFGRITAVNPPVKSLDRNVNLVIRTSTGLYTVTLSPSFTSASSYMTFVTLDINSATYGLHTVQVNQQGGSTLEFRIYDGAGALSDDPVCFSFFCLGS